jgi:hypothetical protein
MTSGDPSTEYYRTIGGAHFHERSVVPYAMTALDTPVYHDYLRGFAADNCDILVVDVGAVTVEMLFRGCNAASRAWWSSIRLPPRCPGFGLEYWQRTGSGWNASC